MKAIPTAHATILAALLSVLAPAYARERPVDPGLHQDARIDVDGRRRAFSYYIPKNMGDSAVPVLVYFHGHGDNLRHIVGKGVVPSAAAQWMQVAEREKFLVFYPLGLAGSDRKTGWNDCRGDATGNPNADDVQLMKALLEFAERLNFTPSQVYVTGMSNGGHMTMRIAMEMAERITAVATIAALLPTDLRCEPPSRPVPILLMHGTNDPIAPFDGGAIAGNRGNVHSAHATVDLWRDWNGVAAAPERTTRLADLDLTDNSFIVERSWSIALGSSPSGAPVVALVMHGAGHTEPSRRAPVGRLMERIVGPQNRDIEMAETVWRFFARFR